MDRDQLGQTATAELCGVSQKTVSNAKTCKHAVSVDSVGQFATGLRVPLWMMLHPSALVTLASRADMKMLDQVVTAYLQASGAQRVRIHADATSGNGGKKPNLHAV
jgi:hypothetical protein